MKENFPGNKFNILTDNILAVSVFLLPFFQIASLILWGILIIVLLAKGEFRNTFSKLKKYPGLLLFIMLYLFYLTGMLWTEDYSSGLEDLEIKLPLLIFPLIFCNLKLTTETYKKVGVALLTGCSLAIFICFFHSLSLYLETDDVHKFFYTSFSFILHPTYFTMYLNLALLIVCHNTIYESERIFHSAILRAIIFFILITGVVLLNSRLAMSATFLTLLFFVVAESVKDTRLRSMFPRFIIQSLLVVVLFFTLIKFNNRFVQISDAIQEQKDTTAVLDTSTHIYYNSTTIRLGLFKNSIQVFKNNFLFGVGTGDVINESVKELNHSHLEYLAEHYTGAHNQYLQTAMSLGIFGLLLLIATILYPLTEYIRSKNFLAVSFVFIIAINALGDTVLRASSLYFFTFFGCFFYVLNRSANSNLQLKSQPRSSED
jgi:O-antigen ligase